jgi:hypothetical protein
VQNNQNLTPTKNQNNFLNPCQKIQPSMQMPSPRNILSRLQNNILVQNEQSYDKSIYFLK